MSLLSSLLVTAAAFVASASSWRGYGGYAWSPRRGGSNFHNPRVNWSRSGRWFDEYRADVPYVLPRLRQLAQPC